MITKFKIFEELNIDNLKIGDEVVCIAPTFTYLTYGKKYIIKNIWDGVLDLIDIVNDVGDLAPYNLSRFITTMEYNAKKFNI